METAVLTRDDLLHALATIPVNAPVRAEEVTASTNATAAEMAEGGAPEWTLVSAAHQTEGRGRLGRTWEDVAGRALLVSVVLRPDAIAPNRASLLSLLAGASMADAIRAVTGRRVACKWPNDLFLHGAKVGGILLESSVADGRLRYVIVGIGVNLDPPQGVEGAGGIGEASPRDLLAAFLGRFEAVYDAGEPSFPERVRIAWLPAAATIGRLVEATTTDGRVISGRAVGLDDFGALRLSTDTGEVRVRFGEVHHLDEGA
jgi:BirA family biotin operon repressor/biotin-[acetyl-CoA-carboxylase] ligase